MTDVTISRGDYDRLLADRRRIDLIELYKKVPRWKNEEVDGLFGTFREAVDELEQRLIKRGYGVKVARDTVDV